MAYLPSGCIQLKSPNLEFREEEKGASLRKHPFLLALRRRGRNVPIGGERGETDVFAG